MIPIKSYGLLSDADTYFQGRLYSETWFGNESDKRQQALNTAKELIDRFNYVGRKTVDNQLDEWPRTVIANYCSVLADLGIPEDIKIAERLIANAFLEGYDIESDMRLLNVTSRGYSSVRSTYDNTLTPEHLSVGIPSAQAWFYLKPYIVDASGVRINRVS